MDQAPRKNLNKKPDTIKYVQINLGRGRAAMAQLRQHIQENKIDIISMQEPIIRDNQIIGLPITTKICNDQEAKCGIAIMNDNIDTLTIHTEQCIAAISFKINNLNVIMYSVYIPPNNEIEPTLDIIQGIIDNHPNHHHLITGDFNCKNSLWGSPIDDAKGQTLIEFIIANDLITINDPGSPATFNTTNGRSWIDITISDTTIARYVRDWKVEDVETLSDHRYISWNTTNDQATQNDNDNYRSNYSTKNADWQEIDKYLRIQLEPLQEMTTDTTENLEKYINKYTKILINTANTYLPVKNNNTYRLVPWWNKDLKKLRKEVRRARRAAQNDNNYTTRTHKQTNYKKVKAMYRKKILEAKLSSWRDFCSKATRENPYSLPYKMAANKIRKKLVLTAIQKEDGTCTSTYEETVTRIMQHIFPRDNSDNDNEYHEEVRRNTVTDMITDDIPITMEEISSTINSMPDNKAPGKDGLPIELIKAAYKALPNCTTKIYASCFRLEHFPREWKLVRVILLNKDGKDPKTPEAYRPITLLDGLAKIYDKLITNRIYYHLHSNDIINNSQYRFRHQKSTTQAIKMIIDRINKARTNNHYISLICLDVRAAFDKIWIPAIMKQLQEAKCPRNIYRIINNYLYGRQGIFIGKDDIIKFNIELGVPQGSAIGPTLWNLAINPILVINLPQDCHIQAFADDVCVLVEGTSRRQIEERGNSILEQINSWSIKNKLDFSIEKSQVMTFKRLKPPKRPPIYKMRGVNIKHTEEIKYLGVTIDNTLSFLPHLNEVKNKATKTLQGLNKISRITWGMKGDMLRHIYKTCVERIVLYGVGAWWREEATSKTKPKLKSIQRLAAIAITKAYKTTSTDALLVLAGLTPIEAKAENEARRFLAMTYQLQLNDNNTININTLNKQSDKWSNHPAEWISIQTEKKEPDNRGYEVFTDGSRDDKAAGCAFVVFKDGVEVFNQKQRINYETNIYQIEAHAIYQALSWIKENTNQDTTIFTDSLSTLHSLNNRITTNNTILKIKNIWKSINPQPRMVWIKAHNNTKGNERADKLAKEATREPEVINLGTDISYHNSEFVKQERSYWQNQWRESSKGRHTYALIPEINTTDHPIPNHYNVQLLTNHGNFPSYLYEHGHRETSRCHCGAENADAIHYIHHCPTYNEKRKNILKDGRLTINQDTYKILTYIMKDSIIRNNIH